MNSSPRAWCFSRFLWLLIPLVLLSCGSEEDSVPPHLIPEAQFAELYGEVQLFEASVKQKLLRGKDADEQIVSYYQEIYTKAGFSQEQFEETKEWYAAHPEKLLLVVEQAMEYISRKQAESGSSEEAE